MEITFDQLTANALEQHASDIHIAANEPIRMRIHGEMRELRIGMLSQPDVQALLFGLMNDTQKESFQKELELDFSYETSTGVRFRINAFNTSKGMAAAFRLIPSKIQALSELSAPKTLASFTELHNGLVLITGPTGSGKSTTLAAMIDHINQNYHYHIITIEDPIEFVHKSNKSLVNQREVGSSTHSFSNALRSALREDPDIILIGELRDLETIRLALTAAETGHLVLSTLHTNSAAQTINRIIDVFPGDQRDMVRTMLSTSLGGVVAQRLLPTLAGQKRVAAFEILVATPAVKNLIRENKIPQIQSLMQVSSKNGMILMDDYIQNLIVDGVIAQEEGKSTEASQIIAQDLKHYNPHDSEF